MLKPLGDHVTIKVTEEEEKTVGGVVSASATKEEPQTGVVVAVGEGRSLEDDEKAPAVIKADDQVMFKKYAGTEVEYEGKEYLIVAGKDIMAIVE